MNNIENYEDAVSYIMSIPRFSGQNENTYTADFLEYMGVYDSSRIHIHVAGTNGKGSTCAYITSLCQAAGKRVGTFTSPHLVDITERIAIDGSPVGQEEFYTCFTLVNSRLHSYQMEVASDYVPSFFSLLFFIAMVAYDRAGVDVVVLETGMGGRLDATNSIPHKDVAVITEIGMDHMEVLGDTLELIAGEKAGIIKAPAPVVFADRGNISRDVIIRQATALNVPYFPIIAPDPDSIQPVNKGIAFSYESRYYNNVMLEVVTPAVYQVENALLALNAVELVLPEKTLTPDIMRKGLLGMVWPGRMETLADRVFIDGAHNVDGIEMFLKSVRCDGCRGQRRLLFSAVGDKQADIMLDMIEESGLFHQVGLARMAAGRGIDAEGLKRLSSHVSNSYLYNNVEEAYRVLRGGLGADDYLYVCGSLYMIGELKMLETSND